jgi:hypothetical protein
MEKEKEKRSRSASSSGSLKTSNSNIKSDNINNNQNDNNVNNNPADDSAVSAVSPRTRNSALISPKRLPDSEKRISKRDQSHRHSLHEHRSASPKVKPTKTHEEKKRPISEEKVRGYQYESYFYQFYSRSANEFTDLFHEWRKYTEICTSHFKSTFIGSSLFLFIQIRKFMP